MRRIIARNHGFDWQDEDAFEDWDTIKSSDTVAKIFDAMDVFLGGVGLVTLTLGAIGVINIMLVAVSERTREIGLRKALGATNRSILVAVLSGGSISHPDERRSWNGGRRITDVPDAGDGTGSWVRSTHNVVHVGHAGDWNAGVSPESWPEFIPRAKPPCCSPLMP